MRTTHPTFGKCRIFEDQEYEENSPAEILEMCWNGRISLYALVPRYSTQCLYALIYCRIRFFNGT